MKKTLLLALCIMLAFAMMFSTVACTKTTDSTNDSTKKTETKKTEEKTETKEEEPEAQNGPLTAYPEPITVTMVRSTDDTLENNTLSKLEDETIDDNRWTKLVKERLNIDIEYLWIAKGADQYTQKFNVAIATGEIPDIVVVNATQLNQLAEAEILADLTAILEDFPTPLSRQIIADGGPLPIEAASFDAGILGVPWVNAHHETSNFLWMRQDWMDKYSLEQPENMDDLMNCIGTFVEEGPEGTVGLAVEKALWGGYAALQGFFNGYHAYPNTWIEVDGKKAFGSIQPEMKLALASLAEMYEKGWLDKEFGVKDGGKVSEDTVAGKNGIFYGQHWNGLWPLQNNRNEDPEAEWSAYPIVSADDKQVLTQISLGTSQWYAVSSESENPEAVMKLFNLYVEKTFDPELQEYDGYSQEPGIEAIWKLSPVITYLAVKNLDNYRVIQEPLKTGDPGDLYGEQLSMFEKCYSYLNDGLEENWGWNRTFGPDSAWATMNYYEINDFYYMNKFIKAPTPTMVEKKATLDKIQDEVIIKIIMGQETVDAFDKFAEDWLALGGQDITDEINNQ